LVAAAPQPVAAVAPPQTQAALRLPQVALQLPARARSARRAQLRRAQGARNELCKTSSEFHFRFTAKVFVNDARGGTSLVIRQRNSPANQFKLASFGAFALLISVAAVRDVRYAQTFLLCWNALVGLRRA
jgi:hypothetical protein